MADIALINPCFEPSYWGLEHALPLTGAEPGAGRRTLPKMAAGFQASYP
jgi:hypothetical protein